MVLGQKGLRLEAWRFGVYLLIPIGASMAFNSPETQQYWADYFKFLTYPANPNIGMKEQFEELRKRREVEKVQRKAYADQIRLLQESAQKSRASALAVAAEEEEAAQKKGWFW